MTDRNAPSTDQRPPLGYDPQALPRELKRHYISASEQDLNAMLDRIGESSLRDLFQHIPKNVLFQDPPEGLPEELSYEAVQDRLAELAEANANVLSFIGDGLPHWKTQSVVAEVANIRTLTTSYTPYQPERSQGTLMTHWIYQCALSMLTGFEAINSSLYERSTALYEAFCCAIRLKRNSDAVIVPEAVYPGDLDVIDTLAADAGFEIVRTPMHPETGRIDLEAIQQAAAGLGDRLAGVAFPQINTLGLLEDVDALTDAVHACGARAIAIVDPMLLATGGLKPPVAFGKQGADMIVGEAQHLAIGPNFGGPGLGLFGVRYNDATKNDIRQTPGRYVGKGLDENGRPCRVMVLSTREQHIRKDKATSNICSNQAFLATIAGAAILARGERGLQEAVVAANGKAREAAARLQQIPGLSLAYPDAPFFNEITLALPEAAGAFLEKARKAGIHAGVDVSTRLPGERDNWVKLSFSDIHDSDDVRTLLTFVEATYGAAEGNERSRPGADIPAALARQEAVGLPDLGPKRVVSYYHELGGQNVAPENTCYPLGSCTMKYNPYINDWAANLPGFTEAHPQAPLEDVQGCLEVLHETQEWFRNITGLAGLTTQPVAGAQGELVGIKLFQAYHRDRGEKQRDVILIPKSAHGTNFATAIMAGFRKTKGADGKAGGIVLLEADDTGRIDREHLGKVIEDYGERISGIMVTNPNTGGIFESDFKDVSDAIHAVGGLVYMDGANMNAIAGWVNLGAMGVDAVHNNTHKTWTIPHGGGGPGDAFVAVSEKLIPYLPGYQIEKREDGSFAPVRMPKSIGSVHRHWGNFAHKVRAYTYLLRLGREGVRRMSAVSVLSARYLYRELGAAFPTLPKGADNVPRMHEFIITLTPEDFERLEAAGTPKALIIPHLGKLFLDFGYHSPTVAFPEVFGLMIEPTESYTKAELDRFAEAVAAIRDLVREHPELLKTAPHFTPVDRVDEVAANRNLVLWERLGDSLPELHPNRVHPADLLEMPVSAIADKLKKRVAAEPVGVE